MNNEKTTYEETAKLCEEATKVYKQYKRMKAIDTALTFAGSIIVGFGAVIGGAFAYTLVASLKK